MRVLSLVNRKGGCGKSTLSTAVAGAFAAGGVPTALVDLDPQGSSTAWAACRPSDRPEVKAVRSRPATLSEDLRRLAAEGALLAVVDSPPHSDAASAGAVAVADAILCPCLPSAFDLHALSTILPSVKNAGKPAGVVLTSVTAGTLGLRDAVAAVKAMKIPLVGVIGRRMAYQYSSAKGLSPVELGRSTDAALEIERLCTWVTHAMEKQ